MSENFTVGVLLFYVQGVINQNRLANTVINIWTETAYCAKTHLHMSRVNKTERK
jgi:hypothetical protein